MSLPSPQPKFMPYLSIIPRRRPTQKTHGNIGHAKNAVVAKFGYNVHGASCDMQIFEYKDDGWQLLYDIKKGDLEPPWREGEIEAAREKERRKVEKEKEDDIRKAKSAARHYYVNVIGDATGEDYKLFVEGYVEGFLYGRQK